MGNETMMKTVKTLSEIKNDVDKLAEQIDAKNCFYLPTYGYTNDFAKPHIEVNSLGYHYVVVERGQELQRITTNSLDELLGNIFANVTFNLGCEYEVNNRIEYQDPRRIIFQHQVELLSQLSTEWAERETQRHAHLLQQYPLDDNGLLRTKATQGYMGKGFSQESAWRKACEKYPLPKSQA